MFRWPLREALLAFEQRLVAEAKRDWQMAFMRWAAIAPHTKKPGKPPELPEILRSDAR